MIVLVYASPAFSQSSRTPPRWWLRAAFCVHRFESTDWHKRTDWRGYPSRDHGGLQIDVGTWAAYAPRGYPSDPADATVGQQLWVGWLVWRGQGWGAWPNSSRRCGLR